MAAKTSEGPRYFTPETFKFFEDLSKNNDRDWFLANKDRYESHVKDPFLHFIADLSGPLGKINRNFIANPHPTRGSMMRIYRDIRFSKDKSPYKTWMAANFDHQSASGEWQAPSFYLHLSPEHTFAAAGMWHPDRVALKKVRDRIVETPKGWQKVVDSKVLIQGEVSARPPKGYDPENKYIEDIKRKDFISSIALKPKDACRPDFLKTYVDFCRSTVPLMKFLTEAVGLEW